MSFENLSTAVAICLGILAATTGVIVSYLFVVDQKNLGGNSPNAQPAAAVVRD
jgi:hypothetical protein